MRKKIKMASVITTPAIFFLLNMKNISNIRSLVFAYKRLKT